MNELEPMKAWLGFIALVISVGTTIWMMLTSPAKKTASDLQSHKEHAEGEMRALMQAVTALGARTQSLESEMKHLPDAKAVMEMRLAIAELSGKIGRMEESQSGVARTVNRVEEFLLKGAGA